MIIWDWIKDKVPVSLAIKKRAEDDVTVVYGKELEICYLNKIGGRFIDLCDGHNTFDDIVNHLMKIYDVDENVLKCDIVELSRDLQWKRLIKLEGS